VNQLFTAIVKQVVQVLLGHLSVTGSGFGRYYPEHFLPIAPPSGQQSHQEPRWWNVACI